jgi:hypothetical protein
MREIFPHPHGMLQVYLVGARGFEPPTSWSQTRRATELRYAPTGFCSAIICASRVLA